MKKILLGITSLLLIHQFLSAQTVRGIVNYQMEDGMIVPLANADIHWIGKQSGTSTDDHGQFRLLRPDSSFKKIIISYIGYRSDTVNAADTSIQITLTMAVTLKNIEVNGKRSSSYISSLSTAKNEIITSDELTKAACCNLSESFITTASVDVSYSDAVTGTKQIQLLGLAGKYSQVMTDVLPTERGLSISHGLSDVPAPWLTSINLNKGAGSVVNGFESITGQIDAELKKPENSEKFFVYGYGNSFGRFEGNAFLTQKLDTNWSTMFLFHGNANNAKIDNNHDGFLDLPLDKQVSALWRWKFLNYKGYQAMFGISYLYDQLQGGQASFNASTDEHTTNAYGVGITTNRPQLFLKTSYTWPAHPYESLGLQLTGNYHDESAYFGLRNYAATESFGYVNLIYQSIIHDTRQQFKTGVSMFYDKIDERLDSQILNRKQQTPGAFFEYSYDNGQHISFVAGIRGDADLNNRFYVSPRFHFQYKFNANSSLRASAGSGWRYPQAIAENMGFLASSRQIIFAQNLLPEQAWNYGLNFTQHFFLGTLPFTFSADLYRTDFINQLIVDADANPQQLIFSNLHGKSFANSFQAELSFDPISQLEIKAAYKFYDVKETYHGTLLEKPLTAKDRALLTATYKTTNDHWQISATAQYIGMQRLPNTAENPGEFQLPQTSPAYIQLFAQINYSVRQWQFFIGGENLSNFVQDPRIIDWENPFSPYFDSSIIWGPVTGGTYYAGFRLTIK